MYEKDIVVIEYGAAACRLRLRGVTSPSEDLATRILLLLIVKRVETSEIDQRIEYLGALVERPTRSFHHLGIRVRAEEEEVTIVLPCCSWIGRGPVAVNMQVLIVEACWGIVPFCDFYRTCLVADVDQIEPVSAAVRIIIIRDGVQLGIGKLVIDEGPVVVLCDLYVDNPRNLGVIRR